MTVRTFYVSSHKDFPGSTLRLSLIERNWRRHVDPLGWFLMYVASGPVLGNLGPISVGIHSIGNKLVKFSMDADKTLLSISITRDQARALAYGDEDPWDWMDDE